MTTTWKEFNLNKKIKFKPSTQGLMYMAAKMPDEKPDENGYYTMQTWKFIETIGNLFGIGSNDPCSMQVFLEE